MNEMTQAHALPALLALSGDEKTVMGLTHTPREIRQQPETWKTTRRIVSHHQAQIREFLADSGLNDRGQSQPVIFLVGAGTSDYIGRALAQLLRRKWRCEALAVPSTDLLTEMDALILPDRPYLWISFSRSGDSAEGVAVLEAALEHYPEIRHLVVSCNRHGRMAQDFAGHPNVFNLVLDDAVNDRGLAMTSSFTNMVVAGQCLAHIATLDEYEQILEQLCVAGENLLGSAANLAARLAEEGYSQACFLGSGTLNAVAKESALKLLELTAGRVHTMSESFLGVRHGPLSAVSGGTLLVASLSGDSRRRGYEMDLLAEIQRKELGGKRIVISANRNAAAERLADEIINLGLPRYLADEYRPPVDVIFGQLLGLFSSLRHGLKPDTPSPNGAISRVVTKVKIYS
ncbi:MAG: SIS domain-containing protein [Blastocatellia bacterium]